ncbi:MAG: carbonic anhydrase [Alphaproteobacteria bacterium]
MTEKTSISRLLAGFKSFRALHYEKRGGTIERLAQEGQAPDVCLIACSDSRVDPAILFNSDPGEIFVIRNVAALVPPYEPDGFHHGTSAAIEFAVRDLKVSHLVVLGHSGCGGIEALTDMSSELISKREFIGTWVSLAHEAQRIAGFPDGGGAIEVERASVQLSVSNLMGFPWIAERVEAGNLALHGWRFNLHAGRLEVLAGSGEDFSVVE